MSKIIRKFNKQFNNAMLFQCGMGIILASIFINNCFILIATLLTFLVHALIIWSINKMGYDLNFNNLVLMKNQQCRIGPDSCYSKIIKNKKILFIDQDINEIHFNKIYDKSKLVVLDVNTHKLGILILTDFLLTSLVAFFPFCSIIIGADLYNSTFENIGLITCVTYIITVLFCNIQTLILLILVNGCETKINNIINKNKDKCILFKKEKIKVYDANCFTSFKIRYPSDLKNKHFQNYITYNKYANSSCLTIDAYYKMNEIDADLLNKFLSCDIMIGHYAYDSFLNFNINNFMWKALKESQQGRKCGDVITEVVNPYNLELYNENSDDIDVTIDFDIHVTIDFYKLYRDLPKYLLNEKFKMFHSAIMEFITCCKMMLIEKQKRDSKQADENISKIIAKGWDSTDEHLINAIKPIPMPSKEVKLSVVLKKKINRII